MSLIKFIYLSQSNIKHIKNIRNNQGKKAQISLVLVCDDGSVLLWWLGVYGNGCWLKIRGRFMLTRFNGESMVMLCWLNKMEGNMSFLWGCVKDESWWIKVVVSKKWRRKVVSVSCGSNNIVLFLLVNGDFEFMKGVWRRNKMARFLVLVA